MMSDEMNKELEVNTQEKEPVQTMEDFAAELEASYASMNQRQIDIAEDESGEKAKWAQFEQMLEDKTVIKVKIAEAVKGGVVAYVDEVRAFIPASQISTEYVEIPLQLIPLALVAFDGSPCSLTHNLLSFSWNCSGVLALK